LVSGPYGRSMANKNSFFVSPDDNLFNYHTYAQINNVSQSMGGKLGGTLLKVNGLYFYHDDDNVPAKIEIDGTPCKIINFTLANLPETTLSCLSPTAPSVSKTDFFGNRGINLAIDNVYTPYNSLAASTPSANAYFTVANQTAFFSNETNDKTVWLTGYFSPKIDSLYEFEIVTNGEAVFSFSTDALSANKKLVASDF